MGRTVESAAALVLLGWAGCSDGSGAHGHGRVLAFAPAIVSAIPTAPGGLAPSDEVALADFDGDGRLDAVHSSVSGASWGVMSGSGDGRFRPRAAGAQFGWGPAVADFNGDGRLDFAVGAAALHLLIDNADATQFATQELSVMSTAGIDGVVVTELTGDARPELVISASPSVVVLVGGGDLQYTRLADASLVAAADFDGDGKRDLAVLNRDRGAPAITILLGNGDGSLRPGMSLPVAATSAFAVGDLDSDGKPDLLAPASGDALGLLRGRGDGSFAIGPQLAVGTQSGVGALALADIDGDGHLDAVALDGAGGALVVLLGDGTGSFAPARSFAVPTARTVRPATLALRDLDGDGRPDLVIAADEQLVALINQSR
jgi:hypothetical protein